MRRFLDRLERAARRVGRRLAGTEKKVVHLAPAGEPRGRALFSYILDPFLLPPGQEVPHSHTRFWESRAIGRILADLGFAVDVIHWTNSTFEPQSDYDLVVDVRLNLERLAPRLGPRCLKVMHAETGHPSFYNPAQLRRLADLAARRGIVLAPFKLLEENHAIESADAAIVLGDEATLATYRKAGKPLWPVPISQPLLYPFPEQKDYAAAARRFLWFGSGGMVHKGLDLVLDAFAARPDFHLTVVGPVERERTFERAYWRELHTLPNIRTLGWVDIAAPDFLALAHQTLALVYPSCSEGQNGGTVTCMHAGLIPVVSRETGVDIVPDRGVLLPDCRVETIQTEVRRLAARPVSELAQVSRAAYDYARAHHTRERFAAEWRQAILAILHRFRPELAAQLT